MNFRLYSKEKPDLDELVNFIVLSRDEMDFKIFLPDYQLKGHLQYKDAVIKKSKRVSWAKLIPLNKPFIGKVVDITINDNIYIHVSLNYIDKDSDNYLKFIEQNKDMKYLLSIIRSINDNVKLNYEKLILPLDKTKGDKTLYNHFLNNLDFIEKQIDNDQFIRVKNMIDKRYFKVKKKNIQKIGVVSNQSIINIQKMFKETIEETKFDVEIKLSSSPVYDIISYEDLEIFISVLKEKAKENKVFVKLM